VAKLLSAALGCVLALTGGVGVQGCSRALFFPSTTLQISPADIGLVYDDVEFASLDGTPLHGWFLHARPIGPDPAPTVVYFHGNAGNVASHLGGVLWLPAHGFQVFLFDYRGFGKSAGAPDVESAREDSIAAVRFAAARPDVDRTRIVGIGQSLGGAIALTTVASLQEEVPLRALVVDSAPSDFRGIAREKLASFWLTWPLQWPLSLTIPKVPSPLASVAALPPQRLLFVHGDRDSVVPLRHSFDLAAAAPGAELLLVPGAEHTQSFELAWVRRHVVDFLRASLEPDADARVTTASRDTSAAYPGSRAPLSVPRGFAAESR
jgi:pimeloyl-ACP methyl ester carboxylesterase